MSWRSSSRGLGSAAAGLLADNPPIAPLVLKPADVPVGFVESSSQSGPVDSSMLVSLGVPADRASTVHGVIGLVQDWSAGASEIRELVLSPGTPADAADVLTDDFQSLLARGYASAQISRVTGARGATAVVSGVGGMDQSSAVLFARGSLFFSLVVVEPTQPGGSESLALAEQLAARQAALSAQHYGAAVSAPLDWYQAAGRILGGALGYFLLLGLWAYIRDPLRRGQRRHDKREVPASTRDLVVLDVTERGRTRRRTAVVLFWIEFGAATAVIAALLPAGIVKRVTVVIVGVLVLWITFRYRSKRSSRGVRPVWMWAGERPRRASVLYLLAAVLGLFGCLCLAVGAASTGEPGGPRIALSGVFFLAAAAVCQRRARRLASISAREVSNRDRRPPVLYLRSFGDDNVRLRSATLGRRSLMERFSPNRFDLFEEVLVRHLSAIGPVVAINPPGVTLPPLGAARETLSDGAWQSAVDSWMDQAALVVIGAPPGSPSPGLVWEIQRVNDRQRWGQTVIVVPPLPDQEIRTRWSAFSAAEPDGPFPSMLDTDPARILTLTQKNGEWVATTAGRRDEWSYSAALEAVQDILSPAGSGARPFEHSDTPTPGTNARETVSVPAGGVVLGKEPLADRSTAGTAGVSDSATSGQYETRQTRSLTRNQRMVLGAAGAVVLIGGTIGFLASNNQSAPHRALGTTTSDEGSPVSRSSTTSVTTDPPVTPSAAQVMASLARYISESVAVRPTVQNAIDGVETCAISPSSGETMLQLAIATRESVIVQVQDVSIGALTNGSQVVSTLEAALQDSIRADQGYLGWMRDFAGLGYACNSNPMSDYEYNAGQQASQQATTDKTSFTAIWNPLAIENQQQTYNPTDF